MSCLKHVSYLRAVGVWILLIWSSPLLYAQHDESGAFRQSEEILRDRMEQLQPAEVAAKLENWNEEELQALYASSPPVEMQDAYVPVDTVPADEYYDDRFYQGGFDGPVYTSASLDGMLYVGGNFRWFNGQGPLNNIAYWDEGAERWQPLDSGGLRGPVLDVAEHNGELFVAGAFDKTVDGQSVNHVARWDVDSKKWRQAGDGVIDAWGMSPGYEFAKHDGDLYVGGTFESRGDERTMRGVAKWNGTNGNWEQVGEGIRTAAIGASRVRTLFSYGSELYAGGDFDYAGDDRELENIARWNSADRRWETVGEGLEFTVYTLTEYDGTLIAAGQEDGRFSDGPTARLAKWEPDAASWEPFEEEPEGDIIRSLARFEDALYAGGIFDETPNGDSLEGVTRWNEQRHQWESVSLHSDFDPEIYSLTPLNDTLIIGGDYYNVDEAYRHISTYDGTSPEAVGAVDTTYQGLNGSGRVLTVYDGDVVAGGSFTRAGHQSVGRIARWDAENSWWVPFGTGFNDDVRALSVYRGELYAGGAFTAAGDGTDLNHIARWDAEDSEWTPVGSGFSDIVHALEVHDGKLFAGGAFEESDNDRSLHLTAKWNEDIQQWVQAGRGIGEWQGPVHSLYDHKSTLYAGGDCSRYRDGDQCIARFNDDSNEWRTTPTGFSHFIHDTQIHDFAPLQDDLYAVGSITVQGLLISTDTGILAQWDHDNEEWELIDPQLTGSWSANVNTANEHTGRLYLGGQFDRDRNDVQLANIARFTYEEQTWEPAGSGTSGEIYDMVSHNDRLFITGDFREGGGQAASHVTTWNKNHKYPETPPQAEEIKVIYLHQNYPNPFNQETSIRFELWQSEHAELEIYDVTGRHVTTVLSQELEEGRYTVSFKAEGLSSGMYIYRLSVGEFSETRKMLLVR